MELTDAQLREEICAIGEKVWRSGMVAANDGNISFRCDDGTVLCTPTGVSKGALSPRAICRVDPEGNTLEEFDGCKVSSEVKVHLRLYREAQHVRAVVHAHPPYATAFAIGGETIISKMMPENIIAMPVIPVAPYATPSTYELADNIAPFVNDYPCCLMEMHGALAWADTLLGAYQVMERLEYTAKLTAITRQLGLVRELDEAEIQKLIAMRPQYGF
ncbi:MAG: class II aldolase/adducin family protein [Actinomycetaceae bacterium]|nr:class II aldolase/adducin family protein [Arcanobacterium sp.]MDD7505145.1 class II aldolase/adducin family protein [Actinomycetaceae bacterium]MDY6143865.1 class II aldolase/adducin family protein [Arcanobacterium sp.]